MIGRSSSPLLIRVEKWIVIKNDSKKKMLEVFQRESLTNNIDLSPKKKGGPPQQILFYVDFDHKIFDLKIWIFG